MNKAMILGAAAAVGLSIGIINAQAAGSGGHGPPTSFPGGGNTGGTFPGQPNTPASSMWEKGGPGANQGASTFSPGSNMGPTGLGPTGGLPGASGYAPGRNR